MATLGNIASLHTSTFSHLSLHQTHSTRNTPTLSLYPQQSKPFSLISTPISLNPRSKTKLRSSVVASALKSLSETDPVAVLDESTDVSQAFPPETGVYAVYNSTGDLQFIGISRNVAASVQAHRKSVPELCCSVKVGIVEEADRTGLTQAWKSWMEEHIKSTGKVPPGNESGNATWVKQAPKKKADLRLMPGRGTKLTVPLEDLIGKVVKENRVVAFIKGSRSAPQCGFSQRVVGILDGQGVDYESLDVLDEDHNSGLRDALKRYSNWPTFPQVFVDGELLGGCDILTSMHENGELSGLLKK